MKEVIKLNIKNHRAGVYAYREIETGAVIYIGKDAALVHNKRHLDHMNPGAKSVQQHIDRVLQANPHKFVYEQVLFCSQGWLDNIEEMMIKFYKPKHNIEHNKEFKGGK